MVSSISIERGSSIGVDPSSGMTSSSLVGKASSIVGSSSEITSSISIDIGSSIGDTISSETTSSISVGRVPSTSEVSSV